jgi:tocopherol cyclase
LRKAFFSPIAMGWYSFVPFMECYHGVISLYNNIFGKLSANDRIIDYTDEIGYIEKDWARSFPSSRLWMQTNHFNKKTAVS